MARIKLTQKFVSQCVANGQTQYFFDKIIPSFYIKVMPKGAISYHVRYQYQGERHSYHLGKASSLSMDEARACAIESKSRNKAILSLILILLPMVSCFLNATRGTGNRHEQEN